MVLDDSASNYMGGHKGSSWNLMRMWIKNVSIWDSLKVWIEEKRYNSYLLQRWIHKLINGDYCISKLKNNILSLGQFLEKDVRFS